MKTKAQHQFNDILASFVREHDRRNSLLIIYYAGHGFSEKGGNIWLRG